MNYTRFFLAVGTVALSASVLPTIVNAASTTGTATVEIIAPLTVTKQLANPLNFGQVATDLDGATVTVNANTGAASSLDGADIVPATSAAGGFDVTGAVSTAYVVTFGAASTLTGAGPAMTVQNYTSDPALPSTDAAGAGVFTVGADLVMGNSAVQIPGTYSGTYTVNVNYQ